MAEDPAARHRREMAASRAKRRDQSAALATLVEFGPAAGVDVTHIEALGSAAPEAELETRLTVRVWGDGMETLAAAVKAYVAKKLLEAPDDPT